MANWGRVNAKEFKDFQKKMESLSETDELLTQCTKGLSRKYLKSVTQLTPVDTGNLKGEWDTIGNLKMNKTGSGMEVKITNHADYASYQEYGHRTRGGKGWVQGRFFMTKTEGIIEAGAPKYLDHMATKFIKSKLGK